MRPFSMVSLKYSCCTVPALRTVSTAFLMSSLLAAALIRAQEAASVCLSTLSCLMVALPEVPPVTTSVGTLRPQDQPRIWISPLCLSSWASPLKTPVFWPTTLRNMSPESPATTGLTSTSLMLTGTAAPFVFEPHLQSGYRAYRRTANQTPPVAGTLRLLPQAVYCSA